MFRKEHCFEALGAVDETGLILNGHWFLRFYSFAPSFLALFWGHANEEGLKVLLAQGTLPVPSQEVPEQGRHLLRLQRRQHLLAGGPEVLEVHNAQVVWVNSFVPGIHQSSMVLQQLPAARLQQLLSLCIDVDEAEDTSVASQLCPELPKIACTSKPVHQLEELLRRHGASASPVQLRDPAGGCRHEVPCHGLSYQLWRQLVLQDVFDLFLVVFLLRLQLDLCCHEQGRSHWHHGPSQGLRLLQLPEAPSGHEHVFQVPEEERIGLAWVRMKAEEERFHKILRKA
mmetsp:Transcript_74116/g.176723  ORF Transcript_74116/g.176723 Transcript_74116/m.176723 type:complete len:285 (-) Transcript_74116:362-1216(-)